MRRRGVGRKVKDKEEEEEVKDEEYSRNKRGMRRREMDK